MLWEDLVILYSRSYDNTLPLGLPEYNYHPTTALPAEIYHCQSRHPIKKI